MEAISGHWGEWGFLILSLLLLTYTMIVIKEEKYSFQESAVPIYFQNFKFLVPSWWNLKRKSSHECSFERQDTRCEWKASFRWLDCHQSKQNIIEQCLSFIKEEHIEFDEENSIIKNPTDFENHPALINCNIEIARIEGTATKVGVERKYMDIFVVRDLEKNGYLLAVSESSILNGLIEGPYFEEVMLNFSFIPKGELSSF